MEITYQMTFGEIIEAIFYKLFRTVVFIVSMGGLVGSVLSQLLRMSDKAFSLQEKIARLTLVSIPVFLIWIVIGALVVGVVQYKSRHNLLQTKRERKLSISEFGLINTIAAKVTEVKWPEIVGVNQNRKYIFIHLSESLAFVVPKRIFSNDNDVKNFYDYVHQSWKRAKRA